MRDQAGFSLLEVLVAAVIMALGLSGLAALLLAGATGTSNAAYRTTAVILADSLAAQVRLTPDAIDTYLSPPPATLPDCHAPHACTPVQYAQYNLNQWQTELEASLPGSSGLVCRDSSPGDGAPVSPACDGAGSWVIKIFWRGQALTRGNFSRYSRELAP